jgi:hypothetical protein
MKVSLLMLSVALVCAPSAHAPAQSVPGALQPDSTAAAAGSLTVMADVDSALVVLDGHRVGITPLTLDSIAPGAHILRVLHPDLSNWLTGAVTDTLLVHSGDRLVRRYAIARAVSLITTPSDASVFLNDSLVGTTPLLLPEDSTFGHSIIMLRKEGFQAAVIHPLDARRGFLHLPLVAEWSANAQEKDLFEQWQGPTRSRTGVYLSGATMVLAGIATAYLKIRADDRQDQYALTGDPSFLTQRQRFDRGAAATFLLTQISFGIFAYFLLSD